MDIAELKKDFPWCIPDNNKIYFTDGDISKCIKGHPNYKAKPSSSTSKKDYGSQWNGCTLPNCVGLASGAFNAFLNNALQTTKPEYFIAMNCNASRFMNNFGNATFSHNGVKYTCKAVSYQSFPREIPPLHSVMCWGGGKNDWGHVAFVVGYDYSEEGKVNTIYTLESNYRDSSPLYEIVEISVSNAYERDNLKYQGFICSPFSDTDANTNTPNILELRENSLCVNVSVRASSLKKLNVQQYSDICLYYSWNEPLEEDLRNAQISTKPYSTDFKNKKLLFELDKPKIYTNFYCIVSQKYINSSGEQECFGNQMTLKPPNKMYIKIDNVYHKVKPYVFESGKFIEVKPLLYVKDHWKGM